MRTTIKLEFPTHLTHISFLTCCCALAFVRLKKYGYLWVKNEDNKKHKRVHVGVGVVVVRRNIENGILSILVGKRKSKQGQGLFALPGGWLEPGESLQECALRELKEETGLIKVHNVNVMAIPPCINEFSTSTTTLTTNTKVNHHHQSKSSSSSSSSLSVFVMVETLPNDQEQPELKEPDKCEGWIWVEPFSKLPSLSSNITWAEIESQGLFPSLNHLIQHMASS
jgi:8-oxo-dGTP diphosphatase